MTQIGPTPTRKAARPNLSIASPSPWGTVAFMRSRKFQRAVIFIVSFSMVASLVLWVFTAF